MATRNIPENKRFVNRSSDKKPTAYSVSSGGSNSNVARKISQPKVIPSTKVSPTSSSPPTVANDDTPLQLFVNDDTTSLTSVNTDTPRAEVTPARRIVVIRNTKNRQVNQEPVDLGNFGQLDSTKIPPIISNEHKSVYFIRRRVVPSEQTESVE